jgi:hypothetical protein
MCQFSQGSIQRPFTSISVPIPHVHHTKPSYTYSTLLLFLLLLQIRLHFKFSIFDFSEPLSFLAHYVYIHVPARPDPTRPSSLRVFESGYVI